jgi:dolichol-phosphate mannosyltransferase
LKLAGYLGIFITFGSGILALLMLADKFLLRGPWKLNFSGPAMLAVAILFLVGIILICLGLIALYIGNIHVEVIDRPIFVIRKKTNT